MENIPFHAPMEIMEIKEQNFFCNEKMDLTLFFNKLEACVIEVANNYLRISHKEEGSFLDWDANMHKNQFKLINPPMVYKKSNKIARKECKQEPPPIGWSKLNFEGPYRANPGPTGLGCIIFSDNESWPTKCVKSLGVMSNNLAELEALIECLTQSREIGTNKLVIGDSQIILNV